MLFPYKGIAFCPPECQEKSLNKVKHCCDRSDRPDPGIVRRGVPMVRPKACRPADPRFILPVYRHKSYDPNTRRRDFCPHRQDLPRNAARMRTRAWRISWSASCCEERSRRVPARSIRRTSNQTEVREKAAESKRTRGRKVVTTSKGAVYDLDRDI